MCKNEKKSYTVTVKVKDLSKFKSEEWKYTSEQWESMFGDPEKLDVMDVIIEVAKKGYAVDAIEYEMDEEPESVNDAMDSALHKIMSIIDDMEQAEAKSQELNDLYEKLDALLVNMIGMLNEELQCDACSCGIDTEDVLELLDPGQEICVVINEGSDQYRYNLVPVHMLVAQVPTLLTECTEFERLENGEVPNLRVRVVDEEAYNRIAPLFH